MAAAYPTGTPNDFTTKVDGVTVIQAAHPNRLQEEVLAIENTIGLSPAGTHGTVKARIEATETAVSAINSSYVSKSGGSLIAPAVGTVGLQIKAVSGQTHNLSEWQNDSGTPQAYITPSGGLVDTKVTPDLDNLYVLTYVFG